MPSYKVYYRVVLDGEIAVDADSAELAGERVVNDITNAELVEGCHLDAPIDVEICEVEED